MTSLADRAASVRVKGDNRKPDPAKDAEYADQLAVETDRTLRHSPSWRAGLPLDESERWPRGSVFTGGAAGRADLAVANRPKTHCPKGHPYDQANTYWSAGHRKCRSCLRTSREAAR